MRLVSLIAVLVFAGAADASCRRPAITLQQAQVEYYVAPQAQAECYYAAPQAIVLRQQAAYYVAPPQQIVVREKQRIVREKIVIQQQNSYPVAVVEKQRRGGLLSGVGRAVFGGR